MGGVDVGKALITFYAAAGTLIMNDGVHLTGNYNNYVPGGGFGGAVQMTDGTFIMNGGEISGNSTIGNGGAVYMYQSSGASTSFTMNGGLIANNTATHGGAVYMYNGTAFGPFTFTMNGGEIKNNEVGLSSGWGGGVYVGPGNTFNYYNGIITLNKAFNGGGLYVDNGGFTMSGGSVSLNTAYGDGGGVCVIGASGSFTMSGGSLTGNTANSTSYAGGGVFFDGGPFTMTAGTITGNQAPSGFCGGFGLNNTGNTALPANVQSLITGNTDSTSSTTRNFYNNGHQSTTTVGGTVWTSTVLGSSMGW
jgi:hypothetical protein